MTSPEGSVAAPKSGGLFEDLIEVLYAPSTVFDRARNKGAFMYALVTALAIGALIFATKNLVAPWFGAQADLAIAQAAAKGTPMPDQMANATRASLPWIFVATIALNSLIGPYINALFLLAGAKFAGARINYAQAAIISVLAGVPRVLGSVLMPIQALVLDGEKARSMSDFALGPARFVDPTSMSPAVLAMLSNVDLTRAWQLILFAIGVSVIGRVSKGAGFIAGGVVLLLNFICQTLPAAFAG